MQGIHQCTPADFKGVLNSERTKHPYRRHSLSNLTDYQSQVTNLSRKLHFELTNLPRKTNIAK